MANLKNSLYILLFFFFAAHLTAQDKMLDSLKNALDKTTNDIIKIKLLSQLAENAPDHEWESYNHQLKELVEQQITNSSGELKKFYTKYLSIALCNEGLIAKNKGDVKTAILFYEKSLALSREINLKENIAQALTNLGRAMHNQGNILKALNYYEEALKLHEQNKDKSLEAFVVNIIADLYKDQDDYLKAIEYYKKSLKINQQINDENGIAYSLNGIGSIYKFQGKHDDALNCFERSLALYEKTNNAQGKAATLNDIGYMYRGKKSPEAILYFKECLRILEKIDYKQSIPSALQNIGVTYNQAGQTDSATYYFKKSLAMAQQLGYPDIISRGANALYLIYKKEGSIDKALQMYELSVKMHDSIFNDNTRKATLKNQFKYEYEKKAIADSLKLADEKKITSAILKQEKTQRYALILSLVLLLVIGFTVFQRIQHNQKLKESKLRNKIASDLHDEVGSSLSSISMYAGVIKMNKDEAMNSSIVEKIENTSRETIENMSDIVWSIQPKNDDFLNVLKKMKGFGNSLMGSANIQFNFIYSSEVEKIMLDIEQRKNLYLIYKEAINNAAKYSKADLVEASIEKNYKIVIMKIKDNGKGFDLAKNNEKGNGLQNMKQRAQDLNGKLKVTSNPGRGTLIQLEFKIT
ncbi:MAG: tetratricopeptide repeat protein [Bacteroidia bacterium]